MALDIALAYCASDAAFATALGKILAQAGHDVVPVELPDTAEALPDTARSALAARDACVVVLSAAGLGTPALLGACELVTPAQPARILLAVMAERIEPERLPPAVRKLGRIEPADGQPVPVEEMGWETVAALDEHELALLRVALRTAKPARSQRLGPQQLYRLARASFAAKDYGQALRYVKDATDLDPEFAEAWYFTGVILTALGKHALASDAMARSLALRPTVKVYWRERARAQFKAKRYQQMLLSSDAALRRDPTYLDAYVARGDALFALGRTQEALAAFEHIVAVDGRNAAGWFGIGYTSRGLKRYQEAEDAYTRALALNPTFVSAWAGLGLLLLNMKQYEGALAACERALALDPTDVVILANTAAMLFSLTRYEDALDVCDHALVHHPNEATLWINRSAALSGLGRHEEGLAASERAIALDPACSLAWNSKGDNLKDLRRYEEALIALERAIVLDATVADTWKNMAESLEALGRTDEAAEARARMAALQD